jgi:hypothetical protein
MTDVSNVTRISTHHLLHKVRSNELEADVEDGSKGILVANGDKVPGELLRHGDLLARGGSLESIPP